MGSLRRWKAPEESILSFISGVNKELPPLADVSHLSREEIEIKHDKVFRIIESETGGLGKVYITPDIATCGECYEELFDVKDRRFRYPFINCTNCGPRLTIIKDVPYDRINTSMFCFPMCPSCREEYENPADRRFHAEPNACPDCGPSLTLLDEAGNTLPEKDPLRKTVELASRRIRGRHKRPGGFSPCR